MQILKYSLMVWVLVAGQEIAGAQELTSGNYLVANGNFIAEYSPEGDFVQQFEVPSPSETFKSITRDLVVDRQRRIHIVQRRRNMQDGAEGYLSTLDTRTGEWVHHGAPDWSIGLRGEEGGIGINDNFVYVPDHDVLKEKTFGIIRFPLGDLTAPTHLKPFPQHLDPDWHQAQIGLDGRLYMLSRRWLNAIHRFDAETHESLGAIDTPTWDAEGIAVAENGHIFVVDKDQVLSHLTPEGKLLESVTVPGGKDMELNTKGWLLIGGKDATIVALNIRKIKNVKKFQVIETPELKKNEGFDLNYVTFVPDFDDE